MSREPTRPDPQQLLAKIQAEEQRKERGKLKIFLGYAAGVGKTYAMLEAARQRKAEGVDVVVAYIETHGRLETESMLSELEILPRKSIEYRGVVLTELDLEAVLARSPNLALVDELAHSNAPGMTHPKRYHDIHELIDAGINVYTTLNIQHLESVSDVVAQVTGVPVRETIPDSVVDELTEIELVDLPPDELLTRLVSGKVYVPNQARRALEKFFRTGNLTALRELAMRRAAQRVDDQVRAYMQLKAIPGPWPVAERLLVCISPSPKSERLVRSTRRLADELGAEWQAIYVETSSSNHLSQRARNQLQANFHLVEELGGNVRTVLSDSAAEGIFEYARKQNFSKLIVGMTVRSRLAEFLSRSITDEILRKSGDIDIYVISHSPDEKPKGEKAALQLDQPARSYFLSTALVAGATLLGFLLRPFISPTNIMMVYLLTVVISAVLYGRGPSILAAVLGVLCFDFFLVEPYYTFAVSDTEYVLTFIALLSVGIVISSLTVLSQERAEAARRKTAETSSLLDLSEELTVASDMTMILQAVARNVSQTFNMSIVIDLPDSDNPAHLNPLMLEELADFNEKEKAVADWAYQHGQPAGAGSDTLSAAAGRYLPLQTSQGTIGVLGILPNTVKSNLDQADFYLIGAFANLTAAAVERVLLAENPRRAQLSQETEKLQAALLNSISHDLRTPLVAITGALSSLDEMEETLTKEVRISLISNARGEAERLNRIVGNLLDMTRINLGRCSFRLTCATLKISFGLPWRNSGRSLPTGRSRWISRRIFH